MESAKGFSLATIHSWISSAYATLFSERISAMATRLGRFLFFDPCPRDSLPLARIMGSSQANDAFQELHSLTMKVLNESGCNADSR
jgi:hypothetical protein